MNIKSKIEDLFSYERNINLIPSKLLESILLDLFPDLENQGIVGIGGEGAIIKAKDKFKKFWAVKVAHPNFQKKSFGGMFGKKEVENIDRARFIFGIAIQKHVYQLSLEDKDFGLVIPGKILAIEDPWLAFRMEFIDGLPLLRFLKERKDFHVSMEIYQKLLHGVQKLHLAGIIHRDIKPENIIITGNTLLNCQIALIDWTQSKMLGTGESKTLPGTQIGTLPYASGKLTIEKNAKDATEEDDVVGLGIVLYEICTFQKVPKPENPDEIRYNWESRKKYLDMLESHIHPYLGRIFRLATDEHNEERFRCVGPMIFELEKVLLRADFYELAEKNFNMGIPEMKAEIIFLKTKVETLENKLEKLISILRG